MNYNSEKGLWVSGALVINPEIPIASSYDWVFLQRFGSFVVLNLYKKSPTTTKHQNQTKTWLDERYGPNGYEIVHSPASLTDPSWSELAHAYYQGKIDVLKTKAKPNMKDHFLCQYYAAQKVLVDNVVQAPRLRLID